ncbi:hypothetical protein C8R32_10296 [Nitrosospira sp. Nsp5]|uniref:Uncharacterized protein n=1 Tax=Nitrosospira multiformis TaxID=1231 RepID=A0ABY0TKX5_9PROT|nr:MULTISPECIES: hypothetical protein [Nitrosospira]PTR10009.1 hypothetical protein C8R32_10296 [Nitrosospira sp. Nsp5]SDQ99367.1 hypothetical protein SAMN05216402_3162 [Nitrosospira multiformis]
MSVLENQLIDAAFRGEWAGPSKLPDLTSLTPPQQAEITIHGGFLRKLLLNLVNSHASMNPPRVYGVKLRGAIIKGEIDLSDCTGMNGAPLPPLLLERCVIHEGSSKKYTIVCNGTKVEEKIVGVINASNARLNRLSLRECRIDGRVDLTDATLYGDLDISDLEAHNSDCYCQISLRRCRVDGSVIAQRARLRIRHGQCTEFGRPDYALNLVSAEVYGSVWLQPGFYADGGVSVRGAHISGNIWAEAAEFVASSEIAFRAESLQCDNAVVLRGSDVVLYDEKAGKECKLKGTLSFKGANIGYLDLRGIRIVGSPKRPKADQKNLKESSTNQEIIKQVAVAPDSAVDLSLARIRDNFDFGNMSSKTGKTIVEAFVEGWIDARGMTVGGDLKLADLEIELPDKWEKWAILASNLRIGGDLILDSINSSIDLTGSHIEHNLNVEKSDMVSPNDSEYGLQAHNITIGNDCDLKAISGTVNLELSRIGGGLKVNANDLAALNAKDTEVRGSVSISGSLKPSKESQSLCFDGGSYHGEFRIADLNFDGGNYHGEFCIADLEFIQSRSDILISMSIEDACIDRDLYVKKVSANRVELMEPSEVRAAKLSFYPGWRLVEALCPLENGSKAAIVAFLQSGQRDIPLSGQSAPIHRMNRDGLLKLESDKVVLDYLRFFCAYVWGGEEGREGPFLIIESENVLGDAQLSSPVSFDQEPLKGGKDKGWTYSTHIGYGGYLFRATLHVAPNGIVTMTDDEQLVEIKGLPSVTYVPHMRIFTPALSPGPKAHVKSGVDVKFGTSIKPDGSVSSFWLPLIFDPDSSFFVPPAKVVGMLHQLGEWKLPEDVTTIAEISLCGLKAAMLRYHSSTNSWGQNIKLRLEGFVYDRFEIIEPLGETPLGEASLSKTLGEAGADRTMEQVPPGWFPVLRARLQDVVSDTQQRANDYFKWLYLQYDQVTLIPQDDPHKDPHKELHNRASKNKNFEPQPYEQLARALRNDGRFEAAKHITLLKLSLERQAMPLGLNRGIFYIMERCFNHGLFPRKSVFVFLGLWIAGTVFFYTANNQPIIINIPLFFEEKLDEKPIVFGPDRPILVLHAPPVSTFVLPDKRTGEVAPMEGPPMAMKKASKLGAVAEYDQMVFERSCGDEVDPLWYALDVLVPLLDLMQEDKCSITMREDGWWWRVIGNIYEILGAIVTPIMLLSVSGLLRRYVED